MNWEYRTTPLTNLNELGGQEWELVFIYSGSMYFKRLMKCENCQFYKSKLEYSRDGSFLSKRCDKGKYPFKWDGCSEFKSK